VRCDGGQLRLRLRAADQVRLALRIIYNGCGTGVSLLPLIKAQVVSLLSPLVPVFPRINAAARRHN